MLDYFLKHIGRYLKYVLLAYAVVSITYTTARFYNITGSSHARTRRSVIEPLPQEKKPLFVAPLDQVSIEKDAQQELESIIYYDQLQSSQTDFGVKRGPSIDMTSDPIFQSKVFSGAMGPSNVQPYYYKASERTEGEDITISTIVTSDRFPVLSRLASRYQGPISAAIHINDDEQKESILAKLQQTYHGNPDMKRHVDVHLIIDKFDRQFNMWRNTAKLYARTDYIMMLDIDFYLCTDFRRDILENTAIMNKLRQGNTALVIPAFEYIVQSDGFNYENFPKTKDDLLMEVFEEEKLDMFHRSWEKGHSATNYFKWYTATEPYLVEDYNFSYEPYVIFKRQGSPWCDERFIGYGANKAACLYEIYISGIDYYVLPNDFIIHQSHDYPEATRKRERLFNRKVYANFREELCLRYSRQFVANNQWETSVADNLRNECRKVRGFTDVINHIDQ
ncbi:putative PHD type zinc finger protein with BAH domain-containing protein [Mucor velutinosus]|uniref:PHD type zinc finger protein with BAH domain-containing protein n=1 Tax=Mucor velutinosus TaxID=708070 RepID=A0AAN7DME7_9FUNG|nr:putative PHD type zinc finger protein with BAH domain-containing protein [Mucor velutinosus]